MPTPLMTILMRISVMTNASAPKERFSGAVAVSITMVVRGGAYDNDLPLPIAIIALG